MSNMLPVAVYGLTVPAGDVMISAIVDFPATVGESSDYLHVQSWYGMIIDFL